MLEKVLEYTVYILILATIFCYSLSLVLSETSISTSQVFLEISTVLFAVSLILIFLGDRYY